MGSPLMTFSQENKIMENLFDDPNTVSDFEGIALLDEEESIYLTPFITALQQVQPIMDNQCMVLPLIKEEQQQLEAEEPEPVGHYISMATCQLPCRETFEGIFNFQLDVNSMITSKSCLYSSNLNKLFTTMNAKCPMKFKCTGTNDSTLYLRALPLFTSPQSVMEPVTRCMHHATTCMKYAAEYKEHVLRSAHPQARYENDPDSERLSVVIPLDKVQSGSDTVTAMFSFHCKNSCMGGMNRRTTEVVFTLEDACGIVQGRTSVLFRVCSCPKRDMEKEEVDKLKAERDKAVHPKRGSPSDDLEPSNSKKKARIAKDKNSAQMDNGEYSHIKVPKWMAPKMIKTALGILFVKSISGDTLTPQELMLKKQYEELIVEMKKH